MLTLPTNEPEEADAVAKLIFPLAPHAKPGTIDIKDSIGRSLIVGVAPSARAPESLFTAVALDRDSALAETSIVNVRGIAFDFIFIILAVIGVWLAAYLMIDRPVRAIIRSARKWNPDIDHWSSYIGAGAPRFYLPMVIQLPNDFIAQTVVVAKSLAARERIRAKLDRLLPDQFPEAIARVYPLELGPPVGWPIQYRIGGPDVAEVRHIAYQLADVLAGQPNARTVNFDWIETGKVLRVKVDQDQAAILGLNSEEVARAINTVISGQTITQVRDGIYLVDVVVRASEEDRLSIGALQTLQIPLPSGGTAPLSQLASIEYDRDWPLIWRRNRQPTLTVQSDVARGVEPGTVVKSLASKVAALRAGLPNGYDIAVGGIVEESDKAMGSVLLIVPAMILAMMTILMVQLQGFNRLFLVMSVAPLGLIGVVPALLLSGKPLGFVALLGVLALIGMTVRNAVILIDQIDVEMARGRRGWDAVVQASLRRFRPILLTASAAILGMIPIAPTVFWGPMAYAIMGGLAIATILTLLFLPALYVAWFRLPEIQPAG